jgi:hypothetical protein
VRRLAALCALLVVAACSSATSGDPPAAHRSAPAASASVPPVSSDPPSTEPPASTTAPPSFTPDPAQLTPQGLWWAVDSTTVMSEDSLENVRGWYRGGHDPVAWGRYLNSSHTLIDGELAFAARHHIVVYLIVPDSNCSVCNGGGDLCGNDITAAQATRDAHDATAAAKRLHIPAGAALFKDIEEVGTCHGELTGSYLDTWYRVTRAGPYRPAFYGNAFTQQYDFVRAYCAAAADDPQFRREVILADDEPEPAIGAPRGKIGPANAPPFRPDAPHCAPRSATRIWQYGESLTGANVTDVDEIMPDTPGLILPDGTVSG